MKEELSEELIESYIKEIWIDNTSIRDCLNQAYRTWVIEAEIHYWLTK